MSKAVYQRRTGQQGESTAKRQCLVPDVSTTMMAESVAGREEKRAAERLDFTNASKDARKGEGAASQQQEQGNRRTVDAAATASARQVKEKAKAKANTKRRKKATKPQVEGRRRGENEEAEEKD